MTTLTLDTGALIALERRRQRVVALVRTAHEAGALIVVPSVCVTEWWRGRTDVREDILDATLVEHTDDALVKTAGAAIAELPGAGCVDAIVMATAARRGGTLLTSDVDDMLRLQAAFPSVRVLRV